MRATTRIVTAMVSALTPPTDASGGTIAPTVNCHTPNRAAAVPATAPWSASASAVPFGNASPTLDTTTNSGTSTAHTDVVAVTPTTSAAPPASDIRTATCSSRRGPTRPTSAALHRPARATPSALTANMIPKACAPRP
jgi:hypothetical protein